MVHFATLYIVYYTKLLTKKQDLKPTCNNFLACNQYKFHCTFLGKEKSIPTLKEQNSAHWHCTNGRRCYLFVSRNCIQIEVILFTKFLNGHIRIKCFKKIGIILSGPRVIAKPYRHRSKISFGKIRCFPHRIF